MHETCSAGSQSLSSYLGQVYSLHRQLPKYTSKAHVRHHACQDLAPAMEIALVPVISHFSQPNPTFSILLCDVGLGAYKLFPGSLC